MVEHSWWNLPTSTYTEMHSSSPELSTPVTDNVYVR